MNRYVILLLSVLLSATAAAQNRRIAFEDITLGQALEKAADGDKLVFMDCYTDWCGPCKMLESDVFTNDSVADHFNASFINIRVDMEKGEGPALSERYGVAAYPTLLFIGPDGTAQHVAVGYMQPGQLLEQAKIAADPALNTTGILARYERGDRSPEFLREYIRVAAGADMPGQAEAAAVEYLTPLMSDFEKFATVENWEIIEMAISDPRSDIFGLVMRYLPYFEQIVGKARVDEKIGWTLDSAVYGFAGHPGEFREYDPAEYAKIVAWLKDVSVPNASALLAHLYICNAGRNGDYAGMVAILRDAIEYNIFYINGSVNSVQPYLDKLCGSDDAGEQRLIVGFLDELLARMPFPHSRARILELMAGIYGALGEAVPAGEALRRAGEEAAKAGRSGDTD